MTLPPFVYSLAFWEAISYTAAGVLLVLYYFGVVPVEWLYSAGAILTAVLAILKFFGVVPELRAKGRIK